MFFDTFRLTDLGSVLNQVGGTHQNTQLPKTASSHVISSTYTGGVEVGFTAPNSMFYTEMNNTAVSKRESAIATSTTQPNFNIPDIRIEAASATNSSASDYHVVSRSFSMDDHIFHKRSSDSESSSQVAIAELPFDDDQIHEENNNTQHQDEIISKDLPVNSVIDSIRSDFKEVGELMKLCSDSNKLDKKSDLIENTKTEGNIDNNCDNDNHVDKRTSLTSEASAESVSTSASIASSVISVQADDDINTQVSNGCVNGAYIDSAKHTPVHQPSNNNTHIITADIHSSPAVVNETSEIGYNQNDLEPQPFKQYLDVLLTPRHESTSPSTTSLSDKEVNNCGDDVSIMSLTH